MGAFTAHASRARTNTHTHAHTHKIHLDLNQKEHQPYLETISAHSSINIFYVNLATAAV